MRENVAIDSNVRIYARSPGEKGRGDLIRHGHNLVVDTGRGWVADLIGGTGVRASHIGIGDGVTPVAPGDTSIQAEKYRDVITRREKVLNGIELQLFVPQANGNGFDYTEAGVLETGAQNVDALDPALLIARFTYPAITKTSSVELTYVWTFNVTAS